MSVRPGSGTPPWALRFWPGHLLVVVLVAAATWLGTWQLDAWSTRRDAEARDLTRVDPVALGEVLGPDDPFPGDSVGRPVTLSGTWLDAGTTYVERGSRYWVVTPLEVGPGDAAIPVVRGVSDTPSAPAVEGSAELVGLLQPTEGTGATDPDPDDDVLPELRVADLVQRVDVDLYGGYAVLTQGTPGLATAEPEALPESGRFTAARNLFYAVEWWIFGGFAVFVWVRYLLDEARPPDDEDRPGDE